MAWAFSAENVNTDFTNFFWPKQNNGFPDFFRGAPFGFEVFRDAEVQPIGQTRFSGWGLDDFHFLKYFSSRARCIDPDERAAPSIKLYRVWRGSSRNAFLNGWPSDSNTLPAGLPGVTSFIFRCLIHHKASSRLIERMEGLTDPLRSVILNH